MSGNCKWFIRSGCLGKPLPLTWNSQGGYTFGKQQPREALQQEQVKAKVIAFFSGTEPGAWLARGNTEGV